MRSIDHPLIAALHDGVLDAPVWTSFLTLLARQSRAIFVGLTIETASGLPIVERQAGAQLPPQLTTIYRDRHSESFLSFRRMREGRVYALEELIDPLDPRHRSFQHELPQPWGMAAIRLIRVSLPSGTAAMLCCAGGRDIGSTVSTMLAALAPHLRTAMRTLLSLRQSQLHADIGETALGRLNFAWAALDADCRIVAASPALKRLIESGAVLRSGRDDRLTLASPRLDRALSAAVSLHAREPGRDPIPLALDADTSSGFWSQAFRIISPDPIWPRSSTFAA